MSRLAIVSLAVALSACASTRPKPVAPAPSLAATSCPQYVVDGVIQFAACEPKKAELRNPPKCDATSPVYVVEGVAVGCAKVEKGR